jgi:hypothetical protein
MKFPARVDTYISACPHFGPGDFFIELQAPVNNGRKAEDKPAAVVSILSAPTFRGPRLTGAGPIASNSGLFAARRFRLFTEADAEVSRRVLRRSPAPALRAAPAPEQEP